jgi:hypothetical protein
MSKMGAQAVESAVTDSSAPAAGAGPGPAGSPASRRRAPQTWRRTPAKRRPKRAAREGWAAGAASSPAGGGGTSGPPAARPVHMVVVVLLGRLGSPERPGGVAATASVLVNAATVKARRAEPLAAVDAGPRVASERRRRPSTASPATVAARHAAEQQARLTEKRARAARGTRASFAAAGATAVAATAAISTAWWRTPHAIQTSVFCAKAWPQPQVRAMETTWVPSAARPQCANTASTCFSSDG